MLSRARESTLKVLADTRSAIVKSVEGSERRSKLEAYATAKEEESASLTKKLEEIAKVKREEVISSATTGYVVLKSMSDTSTVLKVGDVCVCTRLRLRLSGYGPQLASCLPCALPHA